MASLLTTKKLTSIISLLPSSRHLYLTPFFHFSTQTQQKEEIPFIAQYLISSFGFSEKQALKVATDKNLAPIKTPDRPESVVHFLKDIGLTDVQIKNAITCAPQLLAKSVSKTLEPCAREIITGGFTEKTLLQLIQFNPVALNYKNLLSRLQFWRNILGNDEAELSKLLKNRNIINLDTDKRIIPRINLLREYGWSEEEIQVILKKYSSILGIPEERVKSKMKFYFEKAGVNLKYIVKHPYLLKYSLDKRLVPRHHVLSVLKSKGLVEKYNLHVVVSIGETDFVRRFIEPYETQVPELAKEYKALLKKRAFVRWVRSLVSQ